MAREVSYYIGDRVWLKPSNAEPKMLGTIVGVWPKALRAEYDIEIDPTSALGGTVGLWRGWFASNLTHATLPDSLDREAVEQWLAS